MRLVLIDRVHVALIPMLTLAWSVRRGFRGVSDRWKLQASYIFLQRSFRFDKGGLVNIDTLYILAGVYSSSSGASSTRSSKVISLSPLMVGSALKVPYIINGNFRSML